MSSPQWGHVLNLLAETLLRSFVCIFSQRVTYFLHTFTSVPWEGHRHGSESFHSEVQSKLPLLWNREAVSQGLPVIKVNFRGLHLAAELLSEVMFSASRVINFRCLVITNICSQYILQVPSGVVEKAQFVIQSDQVRVMFRELTFWCFISLFGQMELTAPTPHYYWRFSEMTSSKYLIIITNILSSIMLGSVVYFLIWTQPHSEKESISHNTQKRNIRETSD